MDRVEPARLLWISAEDNLTVAVRASAIGGFALEHAAGLPEALEYLKRCPIDAALVCLPLPDCTAGEALEKLQQADGAVPLLLWDPRARVQDAVRLIKSGAFDVWGAEAEPEQLADGIQGAIDERRSRVSRSASRDEPWRRILVGSSQPFQD